MKKAKKEVGEEGREEENIRRMGAGKEEIRVT